MPTARKGFLALCLTAIIAPVFPAATAAPPVTSAPAAPAAPAATSYTLTLTDKRGLALPPHISKPLPRSVTVRVRLTSEASGPKAGDGPALRLVGLPVPGGPAAAPGFGFEIVRTLDGAGTLRDCRATFGLRAADDPGAPYVGEILAARPPGGGDLLQLTLPARQGRSVAGATVLHPLALQLLIGRQYDFRRGGAQTFALLQDWDGDALNPASDLATLRLEPRGAAKITLEDGAVEARRLGYTLTPVRRGASPRTGVLFVGPRGELLQADPPLFGIPFDGGRAKGPAQSEGGIVLLRTNKGETIKGKTRTDGGYDVELYGKYEYPFSTATMDAAGRLARVSERWNGRERVSVVSPSEVRYTFSAGTLGTVSVPEDRAWFLVHWFATDTWEAGTGSFSEMSVGGKQDGTFLPLILSGEYGRSFTLERMPDFRVGGAPLRHYRFSLDAGAARYDLYTDGRRLVHLSGADGGVGLTITRDGSEAVRFLQTK
jgi:hypothetical protein